MSLMEQTLKTSKNSVQMLLSHAAPLTATVQLNPSTTAETHPIYSMLPQMPQMQETFTRPTYPKKKKPEVAQSIYEKPEPKGRPPKPFKQPKAVYVPVIPEYQPPQLDYVPPHVSAQTSQIENKKLKSILTDPEQVELAKRLQLQQQEAPQTFAIPSAVTKKERNELEIPAQSLHKSYVAPVMQQLKQMEPQKPAIVVQQPVIIPQVVSKPVEQKMVVPKPVVQKPVVSSYVPPSNNQGMNKQLEAIQTQMYELECKINETIDLNQSVLEQTRPIANEEAQKVTETLLATYIPPIDLSSIESQIKLMGMQISDMNYQLTTKTSVSDLQQFDQKFNSIKQQQQLVIDIANKAKKQSEEVFQIPKILEQQTLHSTSISVLMNRLDTLVSQFDDLKNQVASSVATPASIDMQDVHKVVLQYLEPLKSILPPPDFIDQTQLILAKIVKDVNETMVSLSAQFQTHIEQQMSAMRSHIAKELELVLAQCFAKFDEQIQTCKQDIVLLQQQQQQTSSQTE